MLVSYRGITEALRTLPRFSKEYDILSLWKQLPCMCKGKAACSDPH